MSDFRNLLRQAYETSLVRESEQRPPRSQSGSIPMELSRRAPDECHFVLDNSTQLLEVCKLAAEPARKAAIEATAAAKQTNTEENQIANKRANRIAEQAYWLVSLLACDEHSLEDDAFKIYCILSGPNDDSDDEEGLVLQASSKGQIITLELALEGTTPTWQSMLSHFAAAGPLEWEIERLFGIRCEPAAQDPQDLQGLPTDYHPLRRDSPISLPMCLPLLLGTRRKWRKAL